MALSEDQRAMLQLLLQSGQSYDDIGSLLGSDVDEVRERARAAFKEMGGEDPDRDVSLTDYLLGQADPIGRADAARHLQSDPEANALAQKLVAQLRLIAPGADLPDLPAPREKRAGRAPSPAPRAEDAAGASAAAPPSKPRFGGAAKSGASRGPSTGSGLTGTQGRLIAALGAGAIVVLVVVVLVTGVFGGGGDSGDTTGPAVSSGDTTGDTTGDGANSQNASNANPTVVGATLEPVGDLDPDARGAAVFGRVKKIAVVQVGAKGLEPTADGENYSIWLYHSDTAAFRLGGVRVGKSGGITAQLPVPNQVLQFISDGTFDTLDISLTKDADLKAEAKRDQKIKRLTLRHIGESVMQGEIKGPGIGAQAGSAGSGATGSAGAGSTGSTGATGPTSP